MDDLTLKTLLAADGPPAHDPGFTLGVMRAIERRRFRREVAVTAGLAAVAAGLLALLAPVLDTVHRGVMPVLGNGAILTLLLAVTLVLPQLMPASRD